MTDRINGFVVSLSEDIREDDSKCILDAIQMIKGVESVVANVSDIDNHICKQQVKSELRTKIFEWFKDL